MIFNEELIKQIENVNPDAADIMRLRNWIEALLPCVSYKDLRDSDSVSPSEYDTALKAACDYQDWVAKT